MSNNRYPEGDEFYLAQPTVKVFAPITLSDEEGEKLWAEVSAEFEKGLEAVKKAIEAKYPNIRVYVEAD